jgi:chemotaxis protein histidine kinase CheA
MQDVLAKLKEIQENYDNEDIQRAITAAEKTAVAEEEAVSEEAVVEETVEEATDEVVDEAEETVEEDSVEEVHEEEVVEESVDNSDFERMLKLAGRSGVMGMNTNVIVAESVEVVEDEVSEEAFIAKEADVDEDDDEEEVDESFETVEEEEVEETVEVPVSALSELMKLAGYEQYKIDEYANEPEEEYSSAEDQMDLGGGLNGPKKAYAAAAGGDNPMDQEPTEIEEDNKLTFEGMYKRYMTQVVEESLEEKE